MQLEYELLIQHLHDKIPEFEIDVLYADNPIVAVAFFTGFIEKSYELHQEEIVNRCAIFTNELSDSDDYDLRAVFDEIAIGLYDKSITIYNDFKNKLNKEARNRFEETIAIWCR